MGKVPRTSRVAAKGNSVDFGCRLTRPATVVLASVILVGLGSVPVQAAPATDGLPGYGYELVSPASTAGQEVQPAAISETGDEVLFASGGGFVDVGNLQSLGTTYRASRTASGWDTRALGGPPASEFPTFTGINVDWTADWWQTDRPLTLWQARPVTAAADDLQPVVGIKDGPWHAVAAPGGNGTNTWGTATDLSGVVQLQRNAARPSLTDGTVDTRNTARFSLVTSARKSDGTLDVRQVAKQAGVSLFPTCDISLGGPSGGITRGAVARDGLSRIVFTMSGTGCTTGARQRVWVSEPFSANPDAVDVSQTRCTVSCGAAAAVRFVGGSLDTSRLFMTTTQKLLDEDIQTGSDIYEYDFRRPEAERLRLATPNPTPANVLGVVAVSDSGSHVYFVARGDLAAADHGAAAPVEGAPNLYVRIADPAGGPAATRFVGVLDEGDLALWQLPVFSQSVISRDGRYLAFASTAPLTADKQPGDAHPDIYRFDANATTGGLRRAWTDDPAHNGSQRTAGSTIPGMSRTGPLANFERGRVGLQVMADDGSSIAFTSSEPLVERDTNAQNDAFVWTADAGGSVAMISDGKDPRGVSAEGMTPNGSTYLIGTVSQLTHEHVATSEGLYAYRRGGGFPKPPAPVDPCRVIDADECQSPVDPLPPFGGIGSGSVTGPGNEVPGDSERPSTPQVRIVGKKSARGTSLRLGVRVTSPGRIRISGSGLRSSTRRVTQAGTYRMTVRLSASAQHTLKRKGNLKVRSRVTLTLSGQRAASTRPTLQFARKPQKRAGGRNAVLAVDQSKGGR